MGTAEAGLNNLTRADVTDEIDLRSGVINRGVNVSGRSPGAIMIKRAVTAAILLLALAAPAFAETVIDTTPRGVSASDPVQLGRLSRNGQPQTWAGAEAYPGEINPSTAYNFNQILVNFAPNASQTVYYDIGVDSYLNDIFVSAYLDTYDPSNKALNWLGDAGTSQNYFGVDTLSFDVVVPQGHKLDLVFNSAVAGGAPGTTVNFYVNAYSDTEYSDTFTQVSAAPEPGVWIYMLLGTAMMGLLIRRSRRTLTLT